MADEAMVESRWIYGLTVAFCVSQLGMIAFFVVGLRRLGPGWSREEKRWAQVKISEYAWFLLLLSVMVAGARGWVLLPMVLVWVALVVTARTVRRRLPPDPLHPA